MNHGMDNTQNRNKITETSEKLKSAIHICDSLIFLLHQRMHLSVGWGF